MTPRESRLHVCARRALWVRCEQAYVALIRLVRLDKHSRKGMLYRRGHAELHIWQQQLYGSNQSGRADAPPTLQEGTRKAWHGGSELLAVHRRVAEVTQTRDGRCFDGTLVSIPASQ